MPSPRLLRAAAAVVPLLAAVPARAEPAAPLASDPVLSRLVEESLAARPELRRADAAARAERARVPQAGALPDPVLSLGIQNDGFDRLRIGEMEGSFYQVMLSQTLPWPGKRGLRTDAARLQAQAVEAGVARARLSTEADVSRAYVALLLARDRLALLGRLEELWRTAAGVARARYEAGDGAQSDVLRAQLELNRLRQRRFALEAEERAQLQALNRLRTRPLGEPVETAAHVKDLGVPVLLADEAAMEDALARSPELAQARAAQERATAQAALARRERFPDVTLSAGVMPRGELDPMWQAGISVPLPVWSSRKQGRAVAEQRARAEAEADAAAAVEQVLRLRVAERRTALAALLDTVRLFEEGLLVQSKATVEATLAQYRVGKVGFVSVLEANAGYVNDEDGHLAALADAQRLAIAAAELSLDPVGLASAGGLGGGGMPGAGMASSPGAALSPSAPAAAGAAAAGAMPAGM